MLKHDRLVTGSQLEDLYKVQQWFKDVYDSLDPELGWVKHYYDYLNIAVTEGFTNAVRHAHSGLPPKTPIELEVLVRADQIDIYIWDEGEPFDPSNLGEPQPGSLLKGGYGWFLLRRAADQVAYHRRNNRNCLAITQYRT